MISLCTLTLKMITLTVTFSTTLIITDDPCLPNHTNCLLSVVAVSEDPAHLSECTKTRVNAILDVYVPRKSIFAFKVIVCILIQVTLHEKDCSKEAPISDKAGIMSEVNKPLEEMARCHFKIAMTRGRTHGIGE
jgi:hypothetical protein